MDFYKGTIPIYDDNSACRDFLHPAGVSFGCVDRDYDIDPVRMEQSPAEIELVPESERDARYDEQEALKLSLEHLYLPAGPDGPPAFEHLDQSTFPDCWAHSPGHAMMLDRLRRQLSVVRPNCVAAATLMNQTNGGWCGLSTRFYSEQGCPLEGEGPGRWPKWTRDRRYDTPALRAAMAENKITESWYDLGRREWDQVLSNRQLETMGFSNVPCPVDVRAWAHSICFLRMVRVERGSWLPLILNQWKGWGRHGLAVLRGAYANITNATAVRLTTALAV